MLHMYPDISQADLVSAVRCRCGQFMMPNEYGMPCDACVAEVLEEERFDAMQEVQDMELIAEWNNVDPELWPGYVNNAWMRSGQKYRNQNEDY